MTRAQAMALLCLSSDGLTFTDGDVRRAYAERVMANHPDHGGDGTLIARLKQARAALLISDTESHTDISSCVLCSGRGKVKLRFGAQTCTVCGGSGDRP